MPRTIFIWSSTVSSEDEVGRSIGAVGSGGVRVLQRADGQWLALFESPYWLARVESEHPELTLQRLVAEGTAG